MLGGMRERIRGLVGAGALAAIALLGWPAISAGSVAGEPVTAEFNYAGLFIGTTVAGDIDALVHRPGDGDPIRIKGVYTDSNGNFSVAKEDGFEFPPLAIDLGVLVIDGKIGLSENGSGNYNEATGAMSTDLSLALELGVDDLEVLGNEIGIPLGTGALTCEFAPLNVAFSTDNEWPAPGKNFEDRENLVDGALAGAWRSKPAAVAKVGDQSVCDLIGGFLKPVGGIWLANSTETIDEMPGWYGCPVPNSLQSQQPCKGYPPICSGGKVGTFPDCVDKACPPSMTGEWPNCVVVDPMTELTRLTIGPKKRKVRAGRTSTLRVRVDARVGMGPDRFRIKLRSSNRRVRVPKSVQVKLRGSTGFVTIRVKTARKATGSAVITASYDGLKAATKVTVRKAVKRKKSRK